MNLLLDTHILLWAAGAPERLPSEAVELIESEANNLYFSAANLWEITIKNDLGRPDFKVDPHLFRRGLIENGYAELPIISQHVLGLNHLPSIHKDPFDRILVAQAEYEGFLLLTVDEKLGRYSGPIKKV
ncbi:type II toxin-antitoxin system VapC family toxin [Marinimicrobium locisalis]|uniref:type II toxin-antitoxin system VapC family toxin n=1 Tax=Marinimicrobium locisalis TaxID=546022 RepID=UPI0032219B60